MNFAEMNEDSLRFSLEKPTHRLVLLHGWGADAKDLMPLGKSLLAKVKKSLEILSLNAPYTHSQGFGRQWYELFPADWAAVPSEISSLKKRLEKLSVNEVPLDQTVVLGFSQGGAMALSLARELPFAGVIACSAYPHPDWKPLDKMPPILLTHGSSDQIVPFSAFEKVINDLRNYQLEFNSYSFEGGHEIPTELQKQFLLALHRWLN